MKEKNLTLFLKKDLIRNQRASMCLVRRLRFKGEETWAAEEGDFKAQCAGCSLPEIMFFTQFANLANYQKRSFIQDYVTDDRGSIFTQKCDPNPTHQTHRTDIFLTQKNNTEVYI